MTDNGLTLPPGTPLRGGRYSIEALIGQGGFGITYRAVDTMLSRLVAIKEFFLAGSARAGTVVRPPPNLVEAFADRKDRIRDEARVLARFRHPNIVTVHEFFEENDTIYVVMELLEGRTLGRILKQAHGPIPVEDAVAYAAAMAAALDAVHAEGLLHRDVKPDNVMVVRHGRVVLVDFGTAREFALGRSSPMSQTLTPGYAPVEQYTARAHFGPATDVYALGATVYHMVTGRMPTPSLDRYAGQELPLPATVNPAVPPAVSDAIMAAMALDSDARPATAGAFAAGLEAAAGLRTVPDGRTVVVDPDHAPSLTGGSATGEHTTGEVLGSGDPGTGGVVSGDHDSGGVVTGEAVTGDVGTGGGRPDPSVWRSWPVRIAALVGVGALAVAVGLGVATLLDDGTETIEPPPPDPPERVDWVASLGGGPVEIVAVPGGAVLLAALNPGDTTELAGAIARIDGATWLEVQHPGGTGWLRATALTPPGPNALANLEAPLDGSVLAVALSEPDTWAAARRAPVREGPSPGMPEVHAYPHGTEEIEVTGNVAIAGGRPWAEVVHPGGLGWVRGDRFDLVGRATFLGEPPDLSCSVVSERGFDYAAAYQYWVWDGSRAAMDPDGDGIPCEEHYESDVISAYVERL